MLPLHTKLSWFSVSQESDSAILIHFKESCSGIRLYHNLEVLPLRVMPLWITRSPGELTGALSSPSHGGKVGLRPSFPTTYRVRSFSLGCMSEAPRSDSANLLRVYKSVTYIGQISLKENIPFSHLYWVHIEPSSISLHRLAYGFPWWFGFINLSLGLCTHMYTSVSACIVSTHNDLVFYVFMIQVFRTSKNLYG